MSSVQRVTGLRCSSNIGLSALKSVAPVLCVLSSTMLLPAHAAETSLITLNDNAESMQVINNFNDATIDGALLLECATLNTAPARLACYDKVVAGGPSTAPDTKKPIDLTKTVKSLVTSDKNAENIVVENLDDFPKSEVLAKAGVRVSEVLEHTPLSQAFDLDKNSEQGLWTPRPYNPNYVLPAFGSFDRNKSPESPTLGEYVYDDGVYDPVELKAQISLKTKVMQDLFNSNADLWVGYTQQMHWQVFNDDDDNSRQFRATDYLPELFLTQPVKAKLPFNGYLRMLGVGAIHHSNGQSDPLSRSWNRIYVMGGAEWENLTVIPKAWVHVKSGDDKDPSDNPDIIDYYGHGEVQALYNFGGGQTLGATGRYNVGENHGAIQLDYTHPLTSDILGYIQIFHGYGESIIDYNHKSTSVGVGITLKEWGL